MKPKKSEYFKYDKGTKKWVEIYPGISGLAYINAMGKHIANQEKLSRVEIIETYSFVQFGHQRHFCKGYTAFIDGKEIAKDTSERRLKNHLKFIYR